MISQLFQSASRDSIHGKLYRNNMDGLNSFYGSEAGLDRLVNNESTAMIVDDPIHSFKEYHCQVHYTLVNFNHIMYVNTWTTASVVHG